MQFTPAHDATPLAPLLDRIQDDPWSLTLSERNSVAVRMPEQQAQWLRLLPNLVEPPTPAPDFPAFLLETERFAALRRAIEGKLTHSELDTATADELQRFVDLYRNYLTDESSTLIEASERLDP